MISEARTGVYAKFWYSLMRAGWLRLWLDSLGHRDNLGQWGSRMPNAFAGAANSWRRKWKTEGERHFYRGFDFCVNFGRRKLSSLGQKTWKLRRRQSRLMDVTGYVISAGFFMDRPRRKLPTSWSLKRLFLGTARVRWFESVWMVAFLLWFQRHIQVCMPSFGIHWCVQDDWDCG